MIEVGDKYRIDSDKYQFILLTKRAVKPKTKDGEAVTPKNEFTWDKSYFTKIEQVCRAIADEELREHVQAGIVNNFERAVDKLIGAIKEAEEQRKCQ